jgi:N-hydroxyarylamine O-acetyltransferase
MGSMQLDRYLQRIGFVGRARPDLPTLRQLHRLHLQAIPYENLDVQLGRRVGFDLSDIFDKLVLARRGGWCYEMNGLLAWALEQIGFRVTRLAGGVLRDRMGDEVVGSHLALCVHLDQLYLADVGFGDALIEPIPVVVGTVRQAFLEFRLEQLDTEWWRFHNHPLGGAASFDFQLREADPQALARRCEWLQTAPESNFVQNAVCQRFTADALIVLRGRVLKTIRAAGVETNVLESVAQYRTALAESFGIELADVAPLWKKVDARHAQWLADRQRQQLS